MYFCLFLDKIIIEQYFCFDTHSTLADSAQQTEPGCLLLQAEKLLCDKQELTPDHICCVDGRNHCNLPCHCVDLIRRRTIAVPLFWTSSRPMSSPWWYIIPLGRQVNYKLAPNTWRRRSPAIARQCDCGGVPVCLYVCGQWGSRVALLSKLSESLSKELVRHERCPHLLRIHNHAHVHIVHTAADATAQIQWKYKLHQERDIFFLSNNLF